jgi:hypothetical protein
MHRTWFRLLTLSLALGGSIVSLHPQPAFRSGLQAIDSGNYTEVGGIMGILQRPLPNPAQTYLWLSVDPGGRLADLTFLDATLHPSVPRLTHGEISGNTIRFRYQTTHPHLPDIPATVDYLVTNAVDTIWIQGGITSAVVCCDIPYIFSHRNVRASPAPTPAIRVSEVEVCWDAQSNRIYQVQYRSELTTNQWVSLGAPVRATTARECVQDKVPMNQPRRMYRVLPVP